MKKTLFVTLLLLYAATGTSQVYWDEERYFSINAGYAHSNINTGSFDMATLEFTTYPSQPMGWEFSSEVRYGKDYLSIEPIGILGTLMMIYTQTHAGFDSDSKMLSVLLAISSAKLPIYPLDVVEFTPYWSLLKLGKVDDSKFQMCGHVGIKAKIFLFIYSYNDKFHTIFIAPFIQHDFGWQLKEGSFIPYYPGFNKESPFRGTSYGFQIGIYL